MSNMFNNAQSFNKPLNTVGDKWNTSKVTNMAYMFNGATAFNQNIGNWDTSKVVFMSSMFQGAVNFNQNLNSWNLTSITNMSQMFKNCPSYSSNPSNYTTITNKGASLIPPRSLT
jgi:surface protein